MKITRTSLIIAACLVIAVVIWLLPLTSRLVDGARMYLLSKDRANYYKLTNSRDTQDITHKLITDKRIPINRRNLLISGKRKIIIFKYKSGNNYVAGYFSYLTKGNHPLLIFLRGGNGTLGIMRPNNAFSFIPGYNVAATLYRGNIYGGTDELGGKDINDIENLIKFFPQLEKYTRKSIKPPYAMLGISRGATQLFSSLAHSSLVSSQVNQAISVSGAVDLTTQMHKRPEMKYLFKQKFKQQTTFNDFSDWLKYRDPVYLAKDLKLPLNVLLIHGDNDKLVSTEAQKQFISALKKNHVSVHFISIKGAEHGMRKKIAEVIKDIVLQIKDQSTDLSQANQDPGLASKKQVNQSH
jgi:dipeptidyl aminopeptidase/acylaminoacyl peptidase